MQKYISEGNAEVLKGYLQYIGKYFEFTSKILNKFGESSDEDELRCEGLVAKKLEKIEKMLKDNTQNQGAPSVSGDTKNKKSGHEQSQKPIAAAEVRPEPEIVQPQKPTTVAASNPTVVGKPQAPQPKTKPIMAASTPTSYPNSREADNQLITLNGEQQRSEAPSHEPVVSSEGKKKKVQFEDGVIKSERHLQTEPQKPKNNSNYRYIYIGAAIGLAIGLAAAYFAGAATLTPVFAAVAAFIGAAAFGMFVCALLVAGVDYGVSRFFDDPKCERQQQPKMQQPCIS